jgi:hypothetical protein
MKRLFVVATCVALLGAAGAFAGEVKGPSTDGVPNTNETAAPANANSICAFSGLNDYIGGNVTTQVQTPAFQFSGGAPGTPGDACRGGSNPDNP